jgi:hypothetical protein
MSVVGITSELAPSVAFLVEFELPQEEQSTLEISFQPSFFCIRDEPATACEPGGDDGAENEVDRAEECVSTGANQPGNFGLASSSLMIQSMNKHGVIYHYARIK